MMMRGSMGWIAGGLMLAAAGGADAAGDTVISQVYQQRRAIPERLR
jgi:hypothetical protein